MIEHTKEPWVFDQYGNVNVNGETIRTMGFALSSCKTSISNSRRIVACVNACAGIPTEHLEAAGKSAPVQSSLNGYLDMKKQREELLAASRSAILALAHAAESDPSYRSTYNELSEAIAKCK